MERRKGGEERESRLHFSPVQAGDLYLPYDGGEKEEEDAAAGGDDNDVSDDALEM